MRGLKKKKTTNTCQERLSAFSHLCKQPEQFYCVINTCPRIDESRIYGASRLHLAGSSTPAVTMRMSGVKNTCLKILIRAYEIDLPLIQQFVTWDQAKTKIDHAAC